MSEAAESSGSAEDDVDVNEVLLEELKRQKRVFKMQLTNLYTRLMRLVSEETIDREAILTALENVEEKKIGYYTTFGRPDSYSGGRKRGGGGGCRARFTEIKTDFSRITHHSACALIFHPYSTTGLTC